MPPSRVAALILSLSLGCSGEPEPSFEGGARPVHAPPAPPLDETGPRAEPLADGAAPSSAPPPLATTPAASSADEATGPAAEPLGKGGAATVDDAAPLDEPPPVGDGLPASHHELTRHAVPELLATAREVFVLDRPSSAGKKLGYLRAGARVARSAQPVGFDGCAGGFYRVAPEGYVCAGELASTDLNHPLARLGRVQPDRAAPLPYVYARSGPIAPNYYTRLPAPAELASAEPERYRPKPLARLPAQALPEELASGRTTPAPYGRYLPTTLMAGRALPNSSFALLESYAHAGREYALSADYLLLATDRLEPVRPSTFRGRELAEGETTLGFVMQRGAKLYEGGPERGLAIARALVHREALSLGGRRERLGGATFLELKDGGWVREDALVVVEPLSPLPTFARGETSWLWISLARQTLVAYEGERPVYATLVSTGADGAGDPKTTRSTVRGQFRIHTKHVTARMDSDDADDAYDHRDVPWVAYFSEGYALHAAYWHDAFGTPKSHGCVNLSPADARWLFQWSEPAVPRLWHGAIGPGTRVVITEQ